MKHFFQFLTDKRSDSEIRNLPMAERMAAVKRESEHCAALFLGSIVFAVAAIAIAYHLSR